MYDFLSESKYIIRKVIFLEWDSNKTRLKINWFRHIR